MDLVIVQVMLDCDGVGVLKELHRTRALLADAKRLHEYGLS